MRPLHYSINVTLDGCVDHRAGSTDEELHRFWAEKLAQAAPTDIQKALPEDAVFVDLQEYLDVRDIQLPEFITAHWWENLLHNQTALRLKAVLMNKPKVVVISIPYHLEPDKE